MQPRYAVVAFVGSICLLGLVCAGRAADVLPEADFCEFPTAKDALAYGWDAEATNGKPILEVVGERKVGRYALKARGKDFMGDWGTLVLLRDVDLSQARKGDKIVFFIKQNASSRTYLNIEGGLAYRTFPVPKGEWVRVELDLDPAEWTWGHNQTPKWGRQKRFAFYSREFTSAEHYLILDGLSFHIGGKQTPAEIPPSKEARPDESALTESATASGAATPDAPPPPRPVSDALAKAVAAKAFPQEYEQAWFLGGAEAFWAVSKRNGSVIGGWNGPRRERCLEAVEGSYFLEDRKDLVHASENGDVIVERQFSPETQKLRLTCTNRRLKGVRVSKTYTLRGGVLTRDLVFASDSAEPFFVSYRSEARLDSAFRQEGSYVGAGAFGPIEAAADISGEKQPMFYTNSRGLILSNPVRGCYFAHYRTQQDGEFVLPWWSYSRAESAKDSFYYTSAGWKLPFGISKLNAGGVVSWQENFAIAPGNYHDFVTRDYGAREDVRKEIERLGSTPAWLEDVKVYCTDGGLDGREYTDFNNIKRMVEAHDEGQILVLVNMAGHNVGDYYVEDGLVGFHGGWITGPELQEWLRKIKAISPRIRVGLYCYMDMACGSARLCKQHPEWFRARDKEGNPVNHFAGFWDSRTTMFNNPECRRAILDQYDRMFAYLNLDFIYLDDAMTNNLVNWETGEVLQDRDCYEFFRGMREVARRHGPDKVLFFNGTGNPHGDIEFVEAYSRLAADFWRPFAGVGLGVETFLINRPGVRVIPLYWTPPLGREYVNRVLALGWIPALEYTPVLDGRPFVSASYEIGNADPINAEYEPDWRRQKESKIESYAMRRLGDAAAMLSFISYEESASSQRIRLNVDSLGLDRNRPLYVWQYRVKDATAYKGFTTEAFARAVYGESGWTLDLVAAPERRYIGDYRNELALDVELLPRALTMLVASNDAAAVYSLDGLPQNFLFAKARGVRVQTRRDAAGGEMTVDVDSARDRCEVVVFLVPGQRAASVSLDGTAITPAWIALGDAVCPLVAVGRGRHAIRIACESRALPVLGGEGFRAALTDGAIAITPPNAANGAAALLVRVRQDGHILFNRTVEKAQGVFRVPLPPQPGGPCSVEVKAAQLPSGWAALSAETVQLVLPVNPPSLPLTPLNPGTVPAHEEVRAVNKKIMGLDILRMASQTTATTVPPFQTDLKGLTVEVLPETVTIDAGTTRKVEGYLGAAFGGFEVANLRTIRIRLKNTYFGAPHIYGPNTHTHNYYPTPRLFAGFMVDYHTAGGYAKRVALSVGVVHPDCNTPYPGYGKGGKPDQVADLGKIVQEGPEKEFDLDLSHYAPEGWDGQVWFSVGSDWALPGRRLNAQILAANQAGGAALRGTDPSLVKKEFLSAKRSLTVPRTDVAPNVDGALDDAAWKTAARTDAFFLIGGLGKPTAKTTAALTYDRDHLYVAFECEEPKRKKPLFGKGDIWRDDEVEIYLDTERAGTGYKHVIINAGGDTLELVRPGSRTLIGTVAKASAEEARRWIVEAAIPFKGLGKTPSPGDSWGLNLCRYRPEGDGFVLEQITWAPTEQGFGGEEAGRFGALTFE